MGKGVNLCEKWAHYWYNINTYKEQFVKKKNNHEIWIKQVNITLIFFARFLVRFMHVFKHSVSDRPINKRRGRCRVSRIHRSGAWTCFLPSVFRSNPEWALTAVPAARGSDWRGLDICHIQPIGLYFSNTEKHTERGLNPLSNLITEIW